jgi:hypothetical protein
VFSAIMASSWARGLSQIASVRIRMGKPRVRVVAGDVAGGGAPAGAHEYHPGGAGFGDGRGVVGPRRRDAVGGQHDRRLQDALLGDRGFEVAEVAEVFAGVGRVDHHGGEGDGVGAHRHRRGQGRCGG